MALPPSTQNARLCDSSSHNTFNVFITSTAIVLAFEFHTNFHGELQVWLLSLTSIATTIIITIKMTEAIYVKQLHGWHIKLSSGMVIMLCTLTYVERKVWFLRNYSQLRKCRKIPPPPAYPGENSNLCAMGSLGGVSHQKLQNILHSFVF